MGVLGVEGVKYLIVELSRPQNPNRAAALAALEIVRKRGIDISSARPVILECVTNSDPAVLSALLPFGEIFALNGREQSLAYSINSQMEHLNEADRVRALEVLTSFGEKAQPALPAVRRELVNPSLAVRSAATNALVHIAGAVPN
jgi:hypothetical protein